MAETAPPLAVPPKVALPDLKPAAAAPAGARPPLRGLVAAVARLAAGPRRTSHRVLEVVAFVLMATGISVAITNWRGFFDLKVYWGAVGYWAGGGSIYDYVTPDSIYGFTYTPFAALVMLPLALLSLPVATVLSCLAIGACTVTFVRWYIDPVARRRGWTAWYAVATASALVILFDPLRETLLYGQVNMYLVMLVGFDLLFLLRRGSRFAGVGIGLATALKLTPGVFLLYLVVTRRWRAALTACSAVAGATLIGAAVAPNESRVFFTDALWNTDRVGRFEYVSNQSLQGAVARLSPHDPSTLLWAASVLAVLIVWAVRVRHIAATGDEKAGFALTGIVTIMISPISWVHHLVWFLPALFLLFDRALDRDPSMISARRRAWLWPLLIGTGFVFASRLVWYFDGSWTNPLVWLASNAYVLAGLALLIGVPVAARVAAVAPSTTVAPSTPVASTIVGSAPSATGPAESAKLSESGDLSESAELAVAVGAARGEVAVGVGDRKNVVATD